MPRFNIVGQKFRGLDPYLPGIEAGCTALLVREPTNQFDPNAIAVWIAGQHVGYLRKEDNKDLAKRIDAEGSPLALDSAQFSGSKTMSATFCRSPNSAYPQIEID